jgi:hypothetical protein
MAKGQKTGGRKEGTPNKVTKGMRDRLTSVLQSELDHLPELFEEVTARDRLQFIIKLIPYIIPQAEIEADQVISGKPNFFDLVNKQVVDRASKSSSDDTSTGESVNDPA